MVHEQKLGPGAVTTFRFADGSVEDDPEVKA
jgi:hypothetical protein